MINEEEVKKAIQIQIAVWDLCAFPNPDEEAVATCRCRKELACLAWIAGRE